MKPINKAAFFLMTAVASLCRNGQAEEVLRNVPLRDARGREIVPAGFVTITEDRLGDIHYTPDVYRRMVRMGANFVVIRVMLGRPGGWPGKAEDPAYLPRLDKMVQMARNVGLQTISSKYGLLPTPWLR